ncbi:MAG: yecA family protein [Kangiellaceae bacterium]
MTNQDASSELSYELFTNMLKQHNIIVDASEVQGILCGMLAGGMNIDDQEWIQALADVINQGDIIPAKAQTLIEKMFDKVCQEFIEADFALKLCLPDDAMPINDRGAAFVNWVQGFLLGFGLHQNDLTSCSAEAKEALEDFSDIAKLDEAMEQSEESEQAFFEVLEYVRIGAMLCFNEMGKSLIDSRQQSPSVH